MYETVLVADRGFLAVRVIRSCQRLGVKAVTLVLPGDEAAPHAHAADEAVPFGAVGPDALAAALLEAAQVTGAQAIHPGGSLPVQAAELAESIRAAGLDWLGPDVRPDSRRLSDGDVGVTLVDGLVVDGWRWLARAGGRPMMAESVAPGAGLVALAQAAADPRWPVASVSANGALDHVVAVRPALAGVDRLVEARTGLDLVARQLGAERDQPIGPPAGYAVSLALFARPDEPPSVVRGWQVADVDRVVVDTMLADGRELTVWPRDPVAVLTAVGADRAEALDRLRAAVDGLTVRTPDLGLEYARALVRDRSVVG
ncbi:MAG: hypothetical protein H0T66_16765 [Geodermatophilaceae bacterium]|nr:hypothetical protein [Geodermatophilaceae bacterium]